MSRDRVKNDGRNVLRFRTFKVEAANMLFFTWAVVIFQLSWGFLQRQLLFPLTQGANR